MAAENTYQSAFKRVEKKYLLTLLRYRPVRFNPLFHREAEI